VSKTKDKPEIEDEGKARDGAENGGNGGSIADRAEEPIVPEVEPKPLGPGGTIPLPKMPGRKQPPTHTKVKITEAHCDGAGQLDEESEVLLIVRAKYSKSTTIPKFDGDGKVASRDYVQTIKPTWVEEIDAFLASNGWKIVAADAPGEPILMTSLTAIEEARIEQMRQDGALD
jgi:hypothetical protein